MSGFQQRIEQLEEEIALLRASLKTYQEAEHQRSEELFVKVFEEGPLGVAIVGLDFRFIHINERLCKMVGYSEAELLERTFVDITHPEDVASDIEYARLLFTGEVPSYTIEKRYITKSGSALWVSLSASLVRDNAGNPLYGLAMIKEITERKQAELDLRESEERFRLLADNSTDMISRHTPEGIYLYVSPASERLLGYRPEEMVGHSVYEFFHPDDLNTVNHSHRAIMEGPETQVVTYRLRNKEGRYIWCETTSRALWDSKSGRITETQAATRDISSRKQVEQALAESEAWFRTAVESMADGLVLQNAVGEIEICNRSALEILGLSEDQIMGRTSLDMKWGAVREDGSPFPGEEHPAMVALWTREAVRDVVMGIHKPQGDLTWININAVPLFRPSESDPYAVVATFTDITEQKLAQSHLFETSKLESLGRLAGGVAHDFNNLLTAISGYTNLAQLDIDPATETARYLENIAVASDRAAALTQQLLIYARRQIVEFTCVQLNDIILRMDPLISRTIGEAYALVYALAEGLWSVQTNPSQIEQVLLNLVVNARDAMPQGGHILIETKNITLDGRSATEPVGAGPGDYVMFAVTDEGAGMTREVQERIFEPFFTTKEVGKGTGLGLATCYGIVKQNKGSIGVQSELGEGTTFKVYLPRTQGGKEGDIPVPEPTEAPSGSETILLVDDEPMVRDIASLILRTRGYGVIEASNGPEAIRLQEEYSDEIHLLLTDVVMPVMSGKELALHIREARPNIKVLYMSGYTQNVVLQQSDLEEDCVLISKPFSSEELQRRVSEALQKE